MRGFGRVAPVLLLAAAAPVKADEPLPQPLSLTQALAIGSTHPALAPLEDAFAPPGGPSTGSAPDQNGAIAESLADRFHACAQAQRTALVARGHADRMRLERERRRHALRITRRFFDVLIADRGYARDNEDMAIAFVTLENVRERHQLGQLSDLEAMQSENRYAEALSRRHASALAQRASRARLAEAIGRPGDLPSELSEPQLDYLHRETPAVESLVDAAMLGNPRLRWLRAELEAARASVEAANATRADLNAAHGSRPAAGETIAPLGISAYCDPMDPAVRRSQFLWKQKALADAAADVRQAVLETWLQVSEKRFEMRARQARLDYREFYLDRSRAMYDLEIRADLGDAMVQLTAAEADLAGARYDLATAMQRLAVSSGVKFLSDDWGTGG